MVNQKEKSGFTLVELIIVMAIIVIVTGISLGSLTSSQSLQVFNNNFDKIQSLISNARSQAITGKGQLDYTDFDHDKCNDTGAMTEGTCTSPDYVTPANYGVYFDTVEAPNAVLFADINPPTSGPTGQKGRYDKGTLYVSGKDLVLDSLTLPPDYTLAIMNGITSYADGSIFFSPNYADISFETLTAKPFLTLKLQDTKTSRCRQIIIHKLAGIPEIKACT